MASNKGQVNIGPGTFPTGTKVELRERIGDNERTKGGKSGTIQKDGTASFSGLEPGQQYWLVGEDEHGRPVTVAAVAKAPGEPPRRPVRDPESVRNELRDRAVDQGAANAPPIEGMRSSAVQSPAPSEQQKRNRETMESAKRTADALAKQNLAGASVDQHAAAQAGLVTVADASGRVAVVTPNKPAGKSASKSGGDAAARKRSAAAKKAAATRRRNARSRAQSSSASASPSSSAQKK